MFEAPIPPSFFGDAAGVFNWYRCFSAALKRVGVSRMRDVYMDLIIVHMGQKDEDGYYAE